MRPVFEQVGEQEVHRGHVVSFAEGVFTAPDGSCIVRDIVRHPGAVVIAPVVDGRTALLVRQFRAAVNGEVLELPAGKRDRPDEPPEDTAGRELAEEVGMAAGKLVRLAEFYNSPGFCDEYSFLYLATDLSPVPPSRQTVEEHHLEIESIPLADALGLIRSGTIRDAKTIIGLTLAIEHLQGA
ncbi:MAG: ADP-ribose pyrophosphatase [Acidimicrobiales bacterium]|nr:MAG: NUDIX hydrolase [Actinomycetota bacterium]MBV6507138.1 ADP-ribose pyrophosphatase [Acidimicrobiales bacterium]RIK05565.1 MAG: hypothetical protein DCC48_09765 [Acidobacteriota bacterium]